MIDIPILAVKDQLKTINEGGRTLIWDMIRKQYVVLQPEELVRQMLIVYLTDHAGYPTSRIRVEKGLVQKEKQGRYDIIIYDKAVTPWMLIECKSHKVNLTQGTFDQLSGYNRKMKAPYYLVSNGLSTFCYTANHEQKKYELLDTLPSYGE